MAEYITKEALRAFPIRANHCDKEHANENFINGIETVMEYAENLPAADVSPVVHGRWVPFHSEAAGDIQYCSACKIGNAAKSDFCPRCGAKMGGAE